MPLDTYPADGLPMIKRWLENIAGSDERAAVVLSDLQDAMRNHQEATAALIGAQARLSALVDELSGAARGIIHNAALAAEDMAYGQ